MTDCEDLYLKLSSMRSQVSLPGLQKQLHEQEQERKELQMKLTRLDGEIKSTKEKVTLVVVRTWSLLYHDRLLLPNLTFMSDPCRQFFIEAWW